MKRILNYFLGKRAIEKKPATYEGKLAYEILANKTFKISEVNNLEFIVSIPYKREQYKEITDLIEADKLQLIADLYYSKLKTFDDLTIIQFADEKGQPYIATFYDGDELWQDPELMDIFIK